MIDYRFDSPKFRAVQYLRERLVADKRVTDLVGNQIYPVVAPQVSGSHVVLMRSQYGTEMTKQGLCSVYASVLAEVYSDDYDESVAIAEAIDTAITEATDPIYWDGDVSIEIAGSVEDFYDGKYIQRLEYTIK